MIRSMSNFLKGLTTRSTRQGASIVRVHYSADEDRDSQWVAHERKKYSTQGAWDSEQEIIHEAGGGERLFADVLNRWGHKIIIDNAEFQPSPHCKLIAGFDHGKANPTAALAGCVDFDGNLYMLAEYYQPGLSPRQHCPQLEKLRGFLRAEVMADPSIFYKIHAQGDGSFKAISELYAEEGITNLSPAPENSEILGMERILSHWIDLENREPTLKIVCPGSMRDIQRPVYGLHNNGCPNLLWELRRTRREELSSAQLVHRNPTERIVDKDNHLRDALKYICLSLPEPAKRSALMRAQEAVEGLDPSTAMVRWNQIIGDFEEEEKPITLGRRGLMRRRR